MTSIFTVGETKQLQNRADPGYKLGFGECRLGRAEEERSWLGSLSAIYWTIAVTGHSVAPVVSKMTSTPGPNCCIFEVMRYIWSIWGFRRLSTATSPQARSMVALKAAAEVGKSSPG